MERRSQAHWCLCIYLWSFSYNMHVFFCLHPCRYTDSRCLNRVRKGGEGCSHSTVRCTILTTHLIWPFLIESGEPSPSLRWLHCFCLEIICILHARSPALCVTVWLNMEAKGLKLKKTSIWGPQRRARKQDKPPDCDNASRRKTHGQRRGKNTISSSRTRPGKHSCLTNTHATYACGCSLARDQTEC